MGFDISSASANVYALPQEMNHDRHTMSITQDRLSRRVDGMCLNLFFKYVIPFINCLLGYLI